MALIDNLTNFANTVGGWANNAIESGKLNMKISGEEKKIADYTRGIGALILEKLDAGESFGDEAAALYESIKASRDVIAAAQADLEANRQEAEAIKQSFIPEIPVCPACGTYVDEDAKFCPQCGTKLETDPAPAEEAPAEACTCEAPAEEAPAEACACEAPAEETPAEAAAPQAPAE